MLNMIQNLVRWLTAPADVMSEIQDPLTHPALELMSQRELADLPFSRRDIRAAGNACAA